MRIAFFAGHLSRRASGVRQMIEGLSGALAARGADIRVFGIADEAWTGADAETWQGAPAEVFQRYGPANLGFMPRLGAALAAYKPDIVHLHGIWMYSSAVAALWAGRGINGNGGKLVISPHGMLAPAALVYSPTAKRIIRAAWQNRAFARAAAYHATAEQEATDTRAYLGDVDVEIVPNGVADTAVTRPDWSLRQKRVVAIGRLHPVKGYDRLIQAWERVRAVYPDWRLEIAGPDPDGYAAQLRTLAEEYGGGTVTISPPQFDADRDALIAHSRLFALPSLTENFALTVPEALVCATPVVASTGAPWQGLFAQGCGWWVDPDPASLANAILQAIAADDTGTLESMGAKGREWALSEFGWDGIAARMEAFYERVMRGERGA